MKFFDNPITNPFYREPESTEDADYVDENPSESSQSTGESQSVEKAGTAVVTAEAVDATANADADVDADAEDHRSNSDALSNASLRGVERARAIADTVGKTSLIISYIGIYLVMFFVSLQSQTQNSMSPYVYSSFSGHSLLTVGNVMSGVIGGVCRLPTSKIIDIFGRPKGFVLMMCFMIIGIILMATTKDVESYATAMVLYWIGNDGVQYVLDVMLSDTSSLRNRGLLISFGTSPYIVTTFAGPALAQSFLTTIGFRWGFGVFVILFPVISLPLWYLFTTMEKKALCAGLYTRRVKSGRTMLESLKFYLIEFDLGGMVWLMVSFVLILLPFDIASNFLQDWNNPLFIALVVMGFVLLFIFPVFDNCVVPKPFVSWRVLKDRTLLGSCIAISALFVSFYCWDAYFVSFIQVVYGLPIQDAGYVANIYDVGSCAWGMVVGFLIRYTNRYKWLGLAAVPLYATGAALMCVFRDANHSIGYIVMCQIFIACAGGTVVICHQVAAMAANEHGDVAIILALLSLFSSVGGSIGSAISGSFWSSTFPQALERLLPESELPNLQMIVGNLTAQLEYPMGSPARDAIIQAYGIGQYRMCLASASMTFVMLVGVWMWRDIKVGH